MVCAMRAEYEVVVPKVGAYSRGHRLLADCGVHTPKLSGVGFPPGLLLEAAYGYHGSIHP